MNGHEHQQIIKFCLSFLATALFHAFSLKCNVDVFHLATNESQIMKTQQYKKKAVTKSYTHTHK